MRNTSVTIEQKIHNRVKEIAEKEDRSISYIINKILKEKLGEGE